MLRVLLGVNLLAGLVALAQAPTLLGWPLRYMEMAATVEPLLLITLTLLSALRDLLRRCPVLLAQGLVIALAMLVAVTLDALLRLQGLAEPVSVQRNAVLAGLTTLVVLLYFSERSRAMSPALIEARLAALNARIRPHFLFNSLNAVLSLIRAQPRQAEEALESLADLFRAALREPGALVSLNEEIALARQYIDLEKLRLGARLQLIWELDELPDSLLIPPMLLQPLLENAVYHGIEPLAEGGTIRISIRCSPRNELKLFISNPFPPQAVQAPGHRMAVDNIRERLSLYYDLEGRLEIMIKENIYQVTITLPCQQ